LREGVRNHRATIDFFEIRNHAQPSRNRLQLPCNHRATIALGYPRNRATMSL